MPWQPELAGKQGPSLGVGILEAVVNAIVSFAGDTVAVLAARY
ncbi:hypothetical protein CGMCC3_g15240 [Colletotrichum fructicola]|nr:uncharacterized protein CGMCC3_g15240 [Colletotrichum fructicola]KAE9568654.1 hypothetical protein CGMCC3_g15240 [Colletotrichum fructicola]